ncbi:MAG: glycosyltransferase family 4 protein [Bacillota bacterium]
MFWKPDIVHIQSNSGYGFFEKTWISFLAKIFGCKSLIHVHGGNMREFYLHSSRVIQVLIKKSALLNDRIITGSPQMKETWALIGIPDVKLVYVGNAVNLPQRNTKRISENITILFLTRVVKEKGIIELIDAFTLLNKEYPNLKLRIVGADTKDTLYVKKYLQENIGSYSIEYVGPVTDEEKMNEYLNADIFAFPTYVEDQSYAIMEAMSYALPCIASNVGGVPSLIKDGENGLLIEPRNTQSLKIGLETLICDPQLRRRLGDKARITIEEGFTWEIRSNEIKKLYEMVVLE